MDDTGDEFSQEQQQAGLFRQLVDNVREVFWLVEWTDPPRVLYVSPAYERVWGDRRDRLYADADVWFQSIHEDDREQVVEYMNQFLDTGEDVRGYYRILRPDGSLRWIWHQSFHVREWQGSYARAVGLGLDVTEQKEAEQKLRVSDEVLRQLPDAVIVSDAGGRIQEWLGKAEDVFGYAADEIRGKRVSVLHARQDGRPPAARHIQAELAEKGRFAGRVPCRRKDGRLITVEASSRSITDGAGYPQTLVSVVRDVTEKVEREEERAQVNQRLQQIQKMESLVMLAGGVAHDFNNILAAIQGNVEVGLQSLDNPGLVGATLQDILTSVRRASDLAGQMLAYAGHSLFASRLLDLNRLICQTCEALDASLPNCDMRVEIPEPLPQVWGEEAQLRQLLVNLITNSSEAVDSEGEVTVRLTRQDLREGDLHSPYLPGEWQEGAYACLEVIDRGCGIAADSLERLFDPFYTTKFTGRGLGLAAVLGIVRRHGGLIRVQSQPEDGTSVWVALPIPEEGRASVASIPTISTSEAGGERFILFADDDVQVRTAFTRLLIHQGYRVLEAEDGTRAVEQFRQHWEQIACIILDLSMPRMNGWQALRRIREMDRDVPVVIVSGYTEEAMTSAEDEDNVSAFLRKPFQLDVLLETLKRLTGE